MVTRLLILSGVGLAVGVTLVMLRAYFGRAPLPQSFDLRDMGVGGARAALVEFVSPYCFECKEALPLLRAASKVYQTPLAVIDARERPELARKYDIRHTPTILVVDSRGSVRGGWLGVPPEGELEAVLSAAGA